jgi:predicted ATP-grasp superfamily ATP-dependent carboligase
MKMRKDYAVVVGLGLNGLGLLRALGHAGVPIVGLDTNLAEPTAATRFGKKIRVDALSGPAFVENLLALRKKFSSNPVLFLTQEASVATVSGARGEIAAAYRFTMPDHAFITSLLNKLLFQAIAERYNFPVPRAARLSASNGIGQLQSLRFPCVLKPATRNSAYARRFAKAYKVTNVEDVQHLWSAMREVIDEVIVQEWIEGEDSDVYFCLQYRPAESGTSVSFVGRKICQWPLLTGGTASCMPAPEVSAELTALTDGFFDKAGFVGIGSMEFKRDRRDGRFYLIEPTVGRSDYQEEIASLNGVNIPLAAYLSELSARLSIPLKPTRPHAWRDPIGYARARTAGAPDPMLKISPEIRICDAYFRVDDPMPYVALKFNALRNRLARPYRITSLKDS